MNTYSKRFFLVMLLGMFLGGAGFAQDSKVTTGVVAFQQQDFESALEALDIALENPGDLKEKNVPKAYFHRAKTKMMLLRQAASSGDMEKAEEYKNFLFDAYADYKKAKETDDGKWGKKIDNDLKMLNNSMLMGASSALQMIAKGDGMTAEDKMEGYREVKKFTAVLMDLDPKDYLGFDLNGQANLNLKDSVAALKDFLMAINLYKENPPTTPDPFIGYPHYRASIIYKYKDNDMDNAYAIIKSGQELLDGELKRTMSMDNLTDEMKAKKQEAFAAVNGDLRRLEMDILLNFPEKREEAIKEFEKAVQDSPEDYIVHVAYANLLEIVDRQKAVEIYLKAIDLKPKEEIALFNLGALYNNIGKEYYDKANETDDFNKADELKKQGNEYLGKALAMFDRAVTANPKSLAAIRAAKQIAITINDMDNYKKFKDMEANF